MPMSFSLEVIYNTQLSFKIVSLLYSLPAKMTRIAAEKSYDPGKVNVYLVKIRQNDQYRGECLWICPLCRRDKLW